MSHTVVGIIEETLPRGLYRVRTDEGRQITAGISTTARQFTIKLIPGDRVTLTVSPFDPTRGRITGKS